MAEYIKALVGLYLPEETEGQGMVEYALILALVSVVAIALLTQIGGGIQSTFQSVVNAL